MGMYAGEMESEFNWVEPVFNVPIYCAGAAHVRVVDGLIHVVYYVEQAGPYGIERVANLRQILPQFALPRLRSLVDAAILGNRALMDG